MARIIANGHLSKGFKPVHWCMDCGSALAEAEVEYEDKTSPAIDVRFAVLDDEALAGALSSMSAGHAGDGPLSMRDLDHHALDPAGQPGGGAAPGAGLRRWCSAMRAHGQRAPGGGRGAGQGRHGCATASSSTGSSPIARGSDLEGLKLQHPFYEREVPVILGEHVTIEAGTGAVHTAPGHGQDDYVVGQRYELAVDNPVGGDGEFLPGHRTVRRRACVQGQ